MPAQQKRTFLIQVRATGDRALKQTVRSLKSVERTTASIKRSLSGLRTLFLATFAGAGVINIARAADSIQLLSDRINIFTGDSVEGARALDLLFEAANSTNTSIDGLAETFNRVALATQELGLSTEELIGFTATLQNTFRLSGASIAESSAASVQLSQGLASGQLRGQELRSVLEQNAVIGGILAETLGTTRGQLIKFAETGQITSDVVLKALAANAQTLNERAQGLGQTFGQTLIKAFNRLKQELNEVNREFNLNEKFQSLIEGSFELGRALIGIAGKVSEAFVRIAKSIGIQLPTADKFFKRIFVGIKTLGGTATELEKVNTKIQDTEDKLKNAQNALKNLQITSQSGAIVNALIPGAFEQQLETATRQIIKFQSELRSLKKERDSLGSGDTSNPFQDLIDSFSKLDLTGKIKQQALSLQELNAQFRSGLIGITDYRESLNKIEQGNLEKRFKDGAISLDEFREGLVRTGIEAETTFGKIKEGFELGSRSYIQNASNFTLQFSKLVDNTFSNLENAIFDFTKGTGDAFARLTQQILDDLLRIAIRSQIISPIAGSFGSLFETGATPAPSPNPAFVTARQGNVFKYAQGGIVTKPTSFPLSTGTGLMAEAGAPEAVVPLTRTSNGDLGVQSIPNNVTVNVNNQAGVDVDVQSQQNGNNQILDITITRAVTNAINSGRLDKSLSANFGVNRKGSR